MSKLYLIPNLLGSIEFEHTIPAGVREVVGKLDFFAVENVKDARRFLRKIHSDFDIDGSHFSILNKRTPPEEIEPIVKMIEEGRPCGIISDAGCPGVADPGSKLVKLAHEKGIEVVPLTGPSSILLALMGSGLNGQSFRFHGYLSKDRKVRVHQLKSLSSEVLRSGETQIFMETPYRNDHIYNDVINHCSPSIIFSIACDLTCESEFIKSMVVSSWKKVNKPSLHKRPCIFLLGN